MRYSRLPLCVLVLLASLPACFNASQERFASLAELNSYQQKEGYVMVDHFGDAWPALVLTERLHHDHVNVTLANSQAIRFDDFEGYRLKIVTLKGEHGVEIVVVYHSEEKE